MQKNTPLTQSLVYELTRQNQGILIDLKEADKTIAQLTLEQCVMKDGHLELLLRLEKAKEQINQLTVKLADAHSEIARLSVALIKATLNQLPTRSGGYYESKSSL